MTYAGIILTFVFLNNVVLGELLGLCPFFAASRKIATAISLGFSMLLIMVLTGLAAWASFRLILVPLRLEYLRLIVFVLVGAALGQLLERALQRFWPTLFRALAVHPPLIGLNCAVLGVALIVARAGYAALQSVIAGFSAGAGFLLALVLMTSIRERLDREWIPEPMRGAPIALVTAGLMAMGFMALDAALLRSLIG